MAGNDTLRNAKAAKNDEFYTQYADIQKEINAYLEYDPDVFRGKTVLLPCDDPEWSNFTKFFAQNFELLGLKKLISTSFAQESKKYKTDWQPTLFEMENPLYDADRSAVCGKIFVVDRDSNGDGRINIDDLHWQYLEGTGDFRSAEVTRLRDEADIIITNPPFSLFREFMAWLVESGKQFSIIGNMNAITYKEVFPLIMENKMWLGASISGGDREFGVPDYYPLEAAGWRIDEQGRKFIRVKGVRWYTNIEHGRRHEPLMSITMGENLKYSRHKDLKAKGAYQRYDNYDAIEIPYTDAIPSDYEGVMGVPISFLDKYCPEQFEILGCTESENNKVSNDLWSHQHAVNQQIRGGVGSAIAYLQGTCDSRLRLLSPSKDKTKRDLFQGIDSSNYFGIKIKGYDKYDRPYIKGRRLYFRILIRKRKQQ